MTHGSPSITVPRGYVLLSEPMAGESPATAYHPRRLPNHDQASSRVTLSARARHWRRLDGRSGHGGSGHAPTRRSAYPDQTELRDRDRGGAPRADRGGRKTVKAPRDDRRQRDDCCTAAWNTLGLRGIRELLSTKIPTRYSLCNNKGLFVLRRLDS